MPGVQNVGHAIHLLVKAAELDPNDAQTWYILGRCQVASHPACLVPCVCLVPMGTRHPPA